MDRPGGERQGCRRNEEVGAGGLCWHRGWAIMHLPTRAQGRLHVACLGCGIRLPLPSWGGLPPMRAAPLAGSA
jgi:hypothetical protein